MTPKELNENIPLTPEEISKNAYKCWKAGAAMVHIHVRNDQGYGEMLKDKFEKTIRLIRSYDDCDVILNLTTAEEANATDEKRLAHVRKLDGIEIASYDAGSFKMICQFRYIQMMNMREELNMHFLGKLRCGIYLTLWKKEISAVE